MADERDGYRAIEYIVSSGTGSPVGSDVIRKEVEEIIRLDQEAEDRYVRVEDGDGSEESFDPSTVADVPDAPLVSEVTTYSGKPMEAYQVYEMGFGGVYMGVLRLVGAALRLAWKHKWTAAGIAFVWDWLRVSAPNERIEQEVGDIVEAVYQAIESGEMNCPTDAEGNYTFKYLVIPVQGSPFVTNHHYGLNYVKGMRRNIAQRGNTRRSYQTQRAAYRKL